MGRAMLSGPRLRWGTWTYALGEEAGAGGLQLMRGRQDGWGAQGSGGVCLSLSVWKKRACANQRARPVAPLDTPHDHGNRQ